MRKMLLISAAALALPAMAMAQTSTDNSTMQNSTMPNSTGGTTETGTGANAMPGGTPNATQGGAMQNGSMQNGGNGGAAGANSQANNSQANISKQDRHFVDTAAQAGIYEVQEGQLAASKGDNSVQAVGNRMVTDHSRINEQLKSIAQSKGISVPDHMSKKQSEQISHLQGLSSQSKFDKEYLKDQRHAHEKAIKLFQKEAHSGSDPDLKSFAANTVPTLQSHLHMIKSAQ